MPHILDMHDSIRQAAAIPFRMEAGGLRVLLITSRGSGRWVIPKGGIQKGFTASQAAEQEAFEEAGIKGIIDHIPLGIYTYEKRVRAGRSKPISVEVFALEVVKQVKKWPEQGERHFEWMSPVNAALAVNEPGLAALFQRLYEMHGGDQPHNLPIAG